MSSVKSAIWFSIITSLSLSCAGSAQATDALAPQGGALPPQGPGSRVYVETAPDYGTTDWGGLNWGIGVALNANLGSNDRVVSAANVNGIVRVTQTNNVSVGFVLEAHYFFTGAYTTWNPYWGHGPFVAIEMGGTSTGAANGVINAYALGWMIGVRQPKWDFSKGTPVAHYNTNSSWNLGVGFRIDPNAKVLGDGIIANQPLPPGETGTEVRLKTTARYGLMVLSSFSF